MDTCPETSESLIARVKDPNDGVAWSEFLAIYRPIVMRMARRRGMQEADAEDLSQRVFLAIAEAIGKWEPGIGRPPFRAWLFTIVRNAIVNAMNTRRRDIASGRTSVQMLLEQQVNNESPSTAEFVRESRRELFRWVAEDIRPEFSQTTWAMFWETAVLGRTPEEVAKALRRSTGAVYMARWRVLKRLKERVGEVASGWDMPLFPNGDAIATTTSNTLRGSTER